MIYFFVLSSLCLSSKNCVLVCDRNTILEQWHERTRVQTGAFGPGARGRGRNSRDVPDRAASGAGGFASFESSRTPVELIEHSLQLDRERLLARTRTNRSGTRILGLNLASGQTGGADSLRKSQQQAPVCTGY